MYAFWVEKYLFTIILEINSVSSRSRARFDNPNISCFRRFPLALLLLPDESGSALIELDKAFVLLIFETVLDVESQRDVVEDILSDFLVVLLEIVEKGFFVA